MQFKIFQRYSNSFLRVSLLVALLLKKIKRTCNINKSRKERRFWARQWILRRNRLGASDTLLKQLALENKEGYRNHLRMPKEKLDKLLSKVQHCIQKQDTVMRQAILPKLKLQVIFKIFSHIRFIFNTCFYIPSV
ncbi:hypothetical protein RN001_012267 [Aquatica leii]|uniref:Uncharacterized protein n=1 Tax=Aquatica leii TaxID=1421715 RepID=A0AAN7NY99_9COLE|nr:hypothetical protein RN001_012267 [Aquatica leii]